MEPVNTRSNILSVKDMNPMSRNFDCEVIVLQKDGEPVTTRDGDMIYRYLVADKTGSVILSVWGELGKDIKSGDILRISGVLFISTSKSCKLKRVGQDTFPFVEKPNMSEMEFQQPHNNNRPTQQPRIPRPVEINRHQQQRGYQNNNNANNSHMNNSHQKNSHPFHQDLDNPI
ncbi:hypothetical protein EDC94DRAFT_525534 [Helicostylum pulchrum]|nr:hypothetical protein EDC94DRAFT_525534 [Helicostylum pulchrum]